MTGAVDRLRKGAILRMEGDTEGARDSGLIAGAPPWLMTQVGARVHGVWRSDQGSVPPGAPGYCASCGESGAESEGDRGDHRWRSIHN